MIKNIVNTAASTVEGAVSTITAPLRERGAREKRARAGRKAAATRRANARARSTAAKKGAATRARKQEQAKGRVDAMLDAVRR